MKSKIANLNLRGTLALMVIVISSLCSLAQAAPGKVGAGQSIALSPQEQQFIASMAPLKVMVDDDFMPLSRYDKATGAYEGISVDLFRQLATRLGLKYELLYSADLSWGAKVDLFKQRKIDLLMPLSFTAERAAVGVFTHHFYETYYAVIAKKSRHIQLKESAGLTAYKIGATKASAILPYVTSLVPASQIVIYDSQALLYQAVRMGDVDVALQNQNVFAEDRFNLEFFDLGQIHTITESTRQYAYYLTQSDAHLQLANILDRQLMGADLSELRTRYERGEDELVKRYVEQKQHKKLLSWGIAGALTLLVFLGAIYLNHRRLSKRLLASLQLLQQQKEELRHSEEKFRAIADCTVNLEIWWGLDNKLLWINPAVLDYTSYSAEECMTMADFFGTLIEPQDLQHVTTEIQKGLKGLSVNEVECRSIRKDGTQFWLTLSWVPLRDAKGTLTGFRISGRDISEHKQLQDQVRQLAFHDALTQLPNRNLLNDRLKQAQQSSQRSACYGALMFLDLDNFKPVNDTYGHHVGDLLLVEAANRLKNCVRKMDTVARVGGDEFVVVLHELTLDHALAHTQAQQVAENVRFALAQSYELTVPQGPQQGTTITHHCTASIGIVLFRAHEASAVELTKWADQAMYKAKQAGGNQVHLHQTVGEKLEFDGH